jgi:hypothetical protein
VAVDCFSGKGIEQLAEEVRAIDPDAKEFWRIECGCTGGVAEVLDVTMPLARKVVDAVREYVGREKARIAARRVMNEPVGYRSRSAR